MNARDANRQRRRTRSGRFAALARAAASAPRALSRHPRSAAFFLFAVAMCFTARPLLRYCSEHRYFAVREVQVQGARRLGPEQVRVWLGMVEGSSIWAASPRALEERLERQPAIARASVRRILPDRLQVVVREREPRAFLRHGAQAYVVDRSGVVIGEAPLRGDLPIITLGVPVPAPAAPQPPATADAGRKSSRSGKAATARVPAAAKGQKPSQKPLQAAAASAAVAQVTGDAHGMGAGGGDDPRDVVEWMPQARELRQAVQVARLLESGAAGVSVSEISLQPGQKASSRPELVAYASDGRLTIRLGWGDWGHKLAAIRRVLAHATQPPPGEAPFVGVTSPRAGEPISISHFAGTLDAHDPQAVVVRWTTTPGMI